MPGTCTSGAEINAALSRRVGDRSAYRQAQLVDTQNDVWAAARNLLDSQRVAGQTCIVLENFAASAVEACGAALRIKRHLQANNIPWLASGCLTRGTQVVRLAAKQLLHCPVQS